MSTVIQMYRKSQYDSFADAEANGGVYSTIVHSVDQPESGKGQFIVDDIVEALMNAVQMMDGSESVVYRVKGGM